MEQPAQTVKKRALTRPYTTFRVEIPQGMMRKEFGIIKLTAQFGARYAPRFWTAMWERVSAQAEFQFLDRRGDGRKSKKFWFFYGLLVAYGHVIKTWENHPMDAVLKVFFTAVDALKKKQEEEVDEVVEKVTTDRRDFVISNEYFVDIESKEWPPLRSLPGPGFDPYRFRVRIPEGGMTLKVFGIIKLTAQFVTRYGNEFQDVLWERVCNETQFQFLKRNPGNDDTFFSQLLVVYANVIMPWGNMPSKSDTAGMEAVLQGFFAAQDEEVKDQEVKDEVVDKVMTDRSDFVVSDDYFLDIEFTPPPQSPPEMPMQNVRSSLPPPPLLEEPDPKRQKLPESDVPEDKFLA